MKTTYFIYLAIGGILFTSCEKQENEDFTSPSIQKLEAKASSKQQSENLLNLAVNTPNGQTPSQVLTEIARFLSENVGTIGPYTLNQHLVDDLGLKYVDLLALAYHLEDFTGVTFTDEMIAQMKTVGNALDLCFQ